MRDETFGPLAPVMKVRDAEEAVASPTTPTTGFRLPSSRDRAARTGRPPVEAAQSTSTTSTQPLRLRCRWAAGRRPASARHGGADGVRKYCRTESLVITRFAGKREPTWYPYTRGRRGLIGRMTKLINGRGRRRRLGLKR